MTPTAPNPTVWWELRGHGAGCHAPGTAYRHDNRARPATGSWVVELVQAGTIGFGRSRASAVRVRPGGVFVFAYGEDSWYGSAEPLTAEHRSRWVSLRGAGLAAHLSALREEHGAAMASPDPADPDASALADAMDHLVAACPPGGAAHPVDGASAVHRFVAAVAAAAQRRGLPGEAPVDRALRLLLAHPHRAWSMKAVAAEHGVSREHLARVFAARVGVPPHRHLRGLRVRRAVELLRCTQLPLAEVARQSGLSSPQTLRRQVRRETGQTPSALRSAG